MEQLDDLDYAGSFYGAQLEALERRKELERVGRAAAGIIVDWSDKGPLYRYLIERRKAACAALETLVHIDPTSPAALIEVASAQAQVKEYLIARGWVAAQLETASQAAQIIEEEYGDDQSERD